MEFLQDIEQLRQIKGMTKRDISRAADITPEYYSKVIHGRADVSSSVLLKLVEAVGGKLIFSLDRTKYDLSPKK